MIVTKALKPGVDHSAASLNSQRESAIKPPDIFFRFNADQRLRVGNKVMKLIRARTGSIKD